MTDEKLNWVMTLLNEAKNVHAEQEAVVKGYRESYLGLSLPEPDDGSSRIKMLDVMRVVEGSLPSLIDPFVGRDICEVEPNNAESIELAKLQETAINRAWNRKNNPLDTMETLCRNLMIDGTAWVRVGTDGEGNPTMENVQFESVIPDPAAVRVSDMRFCFYRSLVTVSEILSNPEWYGEHTLDSLKDLHAYTSGSQFDNPDRVGQDEDIEVGQRALEKIEVFEFYGEYDLDGKGTTTPVMIVFTPDMILNTVERPFPDYTIPFDCTVYVKSPFSIYGKGVAALIDQHQAFRTAITRGIVDNMANSNNGIKFVKKGALDPVNFNRLLDKERVVELNVSREMPLGNAVYDGSFNPLPADVYKIMSDLEQEEENLTGITRYSTGTDARALNQTATGISIITSMSQRRLVFITQHISQLLERVFKKWTHINALMNDLPNIGLDVYVKAGTAGLKQKKVGDLMNMLEVLQANPNIDPSVVNGIVIEMAETLELHSVAESIRQGAAAPKDDIAQRLAVEKEMAAIAKDTAMARKYTAESYEKTVDATRKSLGAE